MSQLISHIHTNSSDYQTNFTHNKALAEQLHERQQQAAGERPSPPKYNFAPHSGQKFISAIRSPLLATSSY